MSTLSDQSALRLLRLVITVVSAHAAAASAAETLTFIVLEDGFNIMLSSARRS